MTHQILATCLLVEIDDCLKHWTSSESSMAKALAHMEELAGSLPCFEPESMHRTRSDGFLFLCSDPEAAVQSAAVLLARWAAEAWPTPHPFVIRAAVRTATWNLGSDLLSGPSAAACQRQCECTPSGEGTLCETTRTLLARGRPGTGGFHSIGEFRIDPEGLPERLFRIERSTDDSGTKAPCRVERSPHPLPTSRTRLIGRIDELEELELQIRRHRFVSVCGPGGCGKTRLALEVARRRYAEHAEGVWLVDLGQAGSGTSVEAAIQDGIGGEFQGGRDLERLAGRSFLLVLDGCEHVVAEVGRVVHKILLLCPNAKILATSRHPIGIPEERVYALGPMATPSPTEGWDVESLLAYPAVELFVECAQARDPNFELVPENAASIGRICARLDGLPLAIEQAASGIGKLTPKQIEDRLATSFQLLRLPTDSEDARHRTMHATIEWSLGLVSEQARRLFFTFGVFAGSWPLEAAEFLAKRQGLCPNEALAAIGDLIESSLVQRVDVPGGSGRYRLLESVREFIADASPPSFDLRLAHAEWVLQLAERFDKEFEGPRQIEWIRELDREKENVQAALTLGLHARLPMFPALCRALKRYWMRTGRFEIGIQWIESALPFVDPAEAELRATLLNALGAYHSRLGRWDASAAMYRGSMELWSSLGQKAPLGHVTMNYAMALSESGDAPGAFDAFASACALFREAEDEWGLGSALMNLGFTQSEHGLFDEAAETLEEAIRLLRLHHHECHLGTAIANRAYVAWRRGEWAYFHQLIRQRIDQLERARDPAGLMALLVGLAADAWEAELPTLATASLRLVHQAMGCPLTLTSRHMRERYEPLRRVPALASEFSPREREPDPNWPSVILQASSIAARFAELHLANAPRANS